MPADCAAFGENEQVQSSSEAQRFQLRMPARFDTDKIKNADKNKSLKKYNGGPSGRAV